MILFLGLVLFATLLTSVPIFLSMVIASMLTLFIYFPNFDPVIIMQAMQKGVANFSLLSIPGFIFTAELMARGKIGKKLIKFTKDLVGHLPGGIAISCVLACMIFGAISGAGAVAIVAIGRLIYPLLIDSGYGKKFSVGIILTASTLAMLVPPGIAMILYSTLTNNSIGKVFMAGLGTGIIFGGILMIYCLVYAIVMKIPLAEKVPFKVLLRSFIDSLWALGLPVIIIGGIYSGVFTATEAACISSVYAIIIEAFIYRDLSFKKLLNCAAKSGTDTGIIFMLTSAGALLSWVLTISQVPQSIVSTLGQYAPITVIILIICAFIIAGMFVDVNSANIVLVPLVYSSALVAGLDPLQFAMVVTLCLAIGMLSPPFGSNLFVGVRVLEDVTYSDAVVSCIPFEILMVLIVLLISFVPITATWLPKLLGML